MVSEAARDSEPDRDLKSELFSTRLEIEDRELVRDLARPLVSEPVSDREPDRDLNSEIFSARVETEPSEALKIKDLPLIPEPVSDREPERDLKSASSSRQESRPNPVNQLETWQDP
ncbi:hypothetical protein E6H25_04055 [Candidatus Bathyarchaeota archaeon]|nr:MAG: hypothetical protein E6H25_04055 [Candidatus Bathyarchaeota archaeon]